MDRSAPVIECGAIAGLLNGYGRQCQAERGCERLDFGLLRPFPGGLDLVDVDAVTARVGNKAEEHIPTLAVESQEKCTEGALGRVLRVQIDGGEVDLPRAALEHQWQLATIGSGDFRAHNRIPGRAAQGPAKFADLGRGVLHHPAKRFQGSRPAGFVGQQPVRVVGTTVLQRVGIFAKDSVRLLGTGAAACGQDDGGEERRERSTRARRAKIHDGGGITGGYRTATGFACNPTPCGGWRPGERTHR